MPALIDPAPQRIAVALSGGVDSAVAAALLKEQGVDIVALTMLLQKTDRPDDAVHVAKTLGIPHHVVDLTAQFASDVMDAFARSYEAGETPVPCAVCNRLIKFGALMNVAKQYNAQALATGHYALRVQPEVGLTELHKGDDPCRDQSYFLFALSQKQIDFLRFPLGHLSKDETRALASRYHLPVAQKKDSQDICFVPCGDYARVVQKMRPESKQPGNIVDTTGRVLGKHQGIIHFTVGQRKGLNLSDRTGDNNEPFFVLSLEAKKNQVIVGPRGALSRQRVFLCDVNWLAAPVPKEGRSVTVRLRSSQTPIAARFFMERGPLEGALVLDEPTLGVAKGQAGVIYDGTRLLGGGWITGSR